MKKPASPREYFDIEAQGLLHVRTGRAIADLDRLRSSLSRIGTKWNKKRKKIYSIGRKTFFRAKSGTKSVAYVTLGIQATIQ